MKFIIWNPEATQPPSVVFNSLSRAVKVKHSLEARYGGVFHVCYLVDDETILAATLEKVDKYVDD